MERLQTIKQSKEGSWTREVEEGIEGWVRGRVRRMGERQGETRGDVVREAENAKKDWGCRRTVERRPLGSAFTRSMAATGQEGRENAIGSGLRIQRISEN